MTDSTPEPGDEAPTFDAPWQARAFALAVALTDELGDETLTWEEFQTRLIEEVNADRENGEPNTVYYRQWLTALERSLVERGILDYGDLAARVAAFENGDRDGHEFVEGDPHAHADRLPDGHAEGNHHDHEITANKSDRQPH
ncbi:nitrile hydratase accessory protein [Haladaptatus caseinilyticus]|uniref:nitrile hydratase accessory protein n=1 Tax=Haladaptatus caseinilyticus TaxID=2993314 RepID=UPI00224A7140|nr:nitrile hydratase accessory protein [Haladaptatus caseinilyticus]